jgi:predicted alpha/beta-fold hydrolase
MQDYFLKEHGVDMIDLIPKMKKSVMEFDNHFTSKMFGYQDGPDYHYKGSCIHRVTKIQVPTLFMNALDDPIIGPHGIDFDCFKENQNIALSTSEHGGHMGYAGDFFSGSQWFYGPALDFLNIYRF